MDFRECLTFDDVLLAPKYSAISSRQDVDLSTRLTNRISLGIPIVGSPMTTVTEAQMAIHLARHGGIGIIHRNMTSLQQAEQIRRVKRSDNMVISNPYTLRPNATKRQAQDFIKEKGVSGLLIVNDENRLVGVLSNRDLLFEENPETLVSELMTSDLITAPPNTSIDQAKKILHKNKVEKLPLVGVDGKLFGLITSSDIQKRDRYPNACRDSRGRLRVGASIGVREDFIDRAHALVDAGVDVLFPWIAHGHLEKMLSTIRALRKEFPTTDIIAGNVATSQGTRDLIDAGVDCVNVGIGPGAACTTRLVAGVGVPQITAIFDCTKEASKEGIPVIADGGIRRSGDLAKAIAAGASSVMLGQLLTGTDESPGRTVIRNGKKYKAYYGMASSTALEYYGEEGSKKVAEGVEALVPVRGSVHEVIHSLTGGLRSAMTYNNARTITELSKNAEFIKCTSAGLTESHPHDVDLAI